MAQDPRRVSLQPEERATVVRETFEAVMMTGFLRWWNSESFEAIAMSGYTPQELWRGWLDDMVERNWGWFKQAAAKSTADNLFNVLAYWKTQANSLGLKEWERLRDSWQTPFSAESRKQQQAVPARDRKGTGRDFDLER